MQNRIFAGLIIALGVTWLGSSLAHGYILGVVADRPESEGAFQGAEQATLTVLEGVGVLGGLALVVIGLIGVLKRRNARTQ